MSFKKNGFKIIKNAVDKDLANFLFRYLKLKKEVLTHLHETRFVSPYDESLGRFTDEQVPNTYSIYGDIAMETVLSQIKNIMEKNTGIELVETYSFARLYKKGDVLSRHWDRASCKVSATVYLGGEPWSLYVNPTARKAQNGVKIDLEPGDALVYKGDKLEHWREEFEGDICGQVFFHYNEKDSKRKYDTRAMLGLPAEFRADHAPAAKILTK
tara:strand:- start:1271 stop:1909 length:639 start_codon:yes stop_codon:yes gene_type:complete